MPWTLHGLSRMLTVHCLLPVQIALRQLMLIRCRLCAGLPMAFILPPGDVSPGINLHNHTDGADFRLTLTLLSLCLFFPGEL